MKPRLLIAAGALCAVLAVVAVLLAVDVGRWHAAIAAGDLRYSQRPLGPYPWHVAPIVPFGLGRRLLGVDDDLAYRRGVRLFRLGNPRLGNFGQDTLAVRSAAQSQLTHAVRSDHDRTRASREANLLGALFLVTTVSGTTTSERFAFYQGAIANFATALRLDPDNDDAKYNLELALLREPSPEVTGHGSGSQKGTQGRGAGIAGQGAGY